MKGRISRLLVFHRNGAGDSDLGAAAVQAIDPVVEELNGEPAGGGTPMLGIRREPLVAQLTKVLSELDAEQLMAARDREMAGEGRRSVLQRIDLLLANVGPIPAGPPNRGSVPTLLSLRHLVDDSFGEGTFRVLSRATLRDVLDCIQQGRWLDAAFSAAHYLVLGHDPEWSRSNHQRMVQAKRDTVELHHRRGAFRRAASACASLRLLQPEPVPADLTLYASVLRSDLQGRLSQRQMDIRTTGTAADLYLLSGQWLPNERDSHSLILAVDSAARGQSDNDPIIEAARVALWLVVTRASGTGLAVS